MNKARMFSVKKPVFYRSKNNRIVIKNRVYKINKINNILNA